MTCPDPTPSLQARIVADDVQYRIGDGPLETLPQGQQVTVCPALASMVLSWESEGQPITVTLAREEYDLHVKRGKIVPA